MWRFSDFKRKTIDFLKQPNQTVIFVPVKLRQREPVELLLIRLPLIGENAECDRLPQLGRLGIIRAPVHAGKIPPMAIFDASLFSSPPTVRAPASGPV